MSQLEANEKMNNTIFDDNMLLPTAPANVKRDVTVVLDNIPSNTISYNECFMNNSQPKLERITSTYGKHSHARLDSLEDDGLQIYRLTEIIEKTPQHYSNNLISNIYDNDLPPIPKLPSKKEIILEVYKQELVVCPGLEFHEDHYSGLPYDPINLTHLNEDIREHLNSKMPFPELKRQVNYPSLANLTDVSILDEMPAENPIFRRMDSAKDYM